MEIGHIYIYGEITSYQGNDSGDYGMVSPKDVLDQLKGIKEKKVLVHINSPGGCVDGGFAIYDILKNSGKQIDTIAEGQCYSIATIIHSAGEERSITSNSEFLIHDPKIKTEGYLSKKELIDNAVEIGKLEDKIMSHYVSHTNLSKEHVKGLMEKDSPISIDDLLKYGFVTNIASPIKAVAKYNLKTPKKNNKMNNKKKDKNRFFEQLSKYLNNKTRNIVIKTATGEDLDFFELEDGNPKVGDQATLDGEKAEGDILMADKRIFVFENGKMTKITDGESDGETEKMEDVDAIVEEAIAKTMKPILKENKKMSRIIAKMQKESKATHGILSSLGKMTGKDFKTKKENKKRNEGSKETKNVLCFSKN